MLSRVIAIAILFSSIASCAGEDSARSVANPPAVSGIPTISVTAPAQNAHLPVGTVAISFNVDNHVLGASGNSHLHLYLDANPVPYHFYIGPSINEENGILYNGQHSHLIHWKDASSVNIFGLSSDSHQVTLRLAAADHAELANPQAMVIRSFSIQTPPPGDLRLESVLSGLSYAVSMVEAPDGRIFYNELANGAIRMIDPEWNLIPTPFCQLPIEAGAEQGLLGLTLDPDFTANHYVYVYYTARGSTKNVVARYTDTGGMCTDGRIILDNVPVGPMHNGGIIQFGPDRKLYIVIGDTGNPSASQDIDSLAGKILRLNSDGTAPTDNPFYADGTGNRDRVFSFGHRNSYGFTFHRHTGDLWETENGPTNNDEVNRVAAGHNYGWPSAGDHSFDDPLVTYASAIAPTGIVSIPEDTVVYPAGYRNNLLFTTYIDGTIHRVVLTGNNLSELGGATIVYNGGNAALLSMMLRTDGYVYVSNGNTIFRVLP